MHMFFRGVTQLLRHATGRPYSTAVVAAAGLNAFRRLAIITPSLGYVQRLVKEAPAAVLALPCGTHVPHKLNLPPSFLCVAS